MFKAKNRVYFYLAILLVLIVFLGWQAHMPGQSYDKDFPALTTAQKSLALTLNRCQKNRTFLVIPREVRDELFI